MLVINTESFHSWRRGIRYCISIRYSFEDHNVLLGFTDFHKDNAAPKKINIKKWWTLDSYACVK